MRLLYRKAFLSCARNVSAAGQIIRYSLDTDGLSNLLPFTSVVVLNTTFQFASQKSAIAGPENSSPESDKVSVLWTRKNPLTTPSFHSKV